MEDSKIVELYFNRDETAIKETQIKYGNYCYTVSYNILRNNEDAQECVSDTYIGAWNSIPPHKPEILSSYLAKITRRLSLNRWRKDNALKRGSSEVTVSFDEIEEMIGSKDSVKEEIDAQYLRDSINRFLGELGETARNIFVCRYFYFDSLSDIAKRFDYTESKVKMSLKRSRDKLKTQLIKEGYFNEE